VRLLVEAELRQLLAVLHKACVSLVGSVTHNIVVEIIGLLIREKP